MSLRQISPTAASSNTSSTSGAHSQIQRRDLTGDKTPLYDVVPKDDFGEYAEYSVIFTNRSLNLMSDPFQKVMRDLNMLLKDTYQAEKVAIIPG